MKTIYFKSGLVKHVSEELVEFLSQRILKGCSNFQIFSNSEGKVERIINISEIDYIE